MDGLSAVRAMARPLSRREREELLGSDASDERVHPLDWALASLLLGVVPAIGLAVHGLAVAAVLWPLLWVVGALSARVAPPLPPAPAPTR